MDAMLLPRIPEAIHEMARRLVQQFHPDRIILFGSYARGTARPDSDADLLIVMPLSEPRRRKAVEMELALAESGLPKDLVIVTPEEVERYRHLPGTLIRSAVQEGVVLYEVFTDP